MSTAKTGFKAALLISLATFTLGLMQGCGVDVESPADERTDGADQSVARTDGADENVGETAEALSACTQTFHHGGNFVETDYEIVQGCDCGAGYVRDLFSVWHTGDGYCYPVRWESVSPGDCRVRVHIHDSALFLTGDCNVHVEKKVPAGSCVGHCGGGSGACYCDSYCTAYGDCCADYAPACTNNSCQGHCGGQAPGGCFCDAVCSAFGDCCSDKSTYCP